jgi:hypothetical protein
MMNFLSKAGLYEIHSLNDNFSSLKTDYSNPYDFIGETFEYYCEKEKTKKTFELELDIETEKYYGSIDGTKILAKNIIENKLNFTFKVVGKCKSCNDYHISFLLNVFSNNEIIKSVGFKDTINISQITKSSHDTNIFVKKVGAFPQIKILPNKIITKYFKKETNTWYFKGINALNENYGIGSFAYFRRIIEKELINIIEDIKTLPDSHKSEIDKLLEKHNENPKVSTIYSNIFEYLPNSLKDLGDNPIKLLYNQTSEGLHSMTEEQCLNKAKNILKLLNFVIKKINEEKSEIRELREIIKGLK